MFERDILTAIGNPAAHSAVRFWRRDPNRWLLVAPRLQ
jgi:hypothetical protein